MKAVSGRSKQSAQTKLSICMMMLLPEYKDRIIEMAWEDRTPFEAIEFQFNLPEKEVIKLMRRELSPGSFRMWRKRVTKSSNLKHQKNRKKSINRFKCSRQKSISNNKISKR